MDPRTVAHVLSEIASLLELRRENRFKIRAYRTAAQAVLDLDTDDIAPLLRSGELDAVPGIGPVTRTVIADLVSGGESRYLEQLRETTPEGLVEMLRVPGLATAKIQLIHEGLGIQTLDELEEAARDGRLTTLPRFGPKTAERILKGIAFLRESGALVLYPRGVAEAGRLAAMVRRHPDVLWAEVAGSVRRRREVIADIDVVAACRGEPADVAASFGRAPGVKTAVAAGGGSIAVRYVDATRLDLHCVRPEHFAIAFWRATGSTTHVADVTGRARARGMRIAGDELHDSAGVVVPVPDEQALYAALGLAFVPPELREGRGEVGAAAHGAIPALIELDDICGVLHCHSTYSDGSATIAEMAEAARARGWRYLGVSDHSQSAFYAGGLSRDAVHRQHDEIDAANERWADFRVLKGIEADILPSGDIDYDEGLLERFDYVIASVHSRFGMDESTMTERVLRALDDPHVTILGHPTGRLLLSREPYAIDIEAVIEKASEVGAAIELNADPHRLDLDWRLCRSAKERGVLIEIGPDAHSPRGLDNVAVGIGVARKGWLEAGDVLNTRSAEGIVRMAARRRRARREDAGGVADGE
jgi:DNA polymerase (family X)